LAVSQLPYRITIYRAGNPDLIRCSVKIVIQISIYMPGGRYYLPGGFLQGSSPCPGTSRKIGNKNKLVTRQQIKMRSVKLWQEQTLK